MILLCVFSNNVFSDGEDNIPSEYLLNNLKGYRLLENKNYEESIYYFKKAIKINPKFVIAYNNLGSAYYNLKEYEEAIKYFEKVIELDSNYSRAYINLAACYFWEKSYYRAYRYYRRGKSVDENYVENRLDYDESLTKIEEELKESPNDKELEGIYNRLLDMR